MNKNIIAVELKKIKEKYNLTNESWSKRSGVPMGTISRFLCEKSLNAPNYPAMGALLRCVGESLDEFYDRITVKTDVPADVLKLDVVPVGVVDGTQVDVPEAKKEIQERIILQAEEIQKLKAESSEKDMQIEVMEIRLLTMERTLEAISALAAAK